MKKICVILLLFTVLCANAYALDDGLTNMRNKIFNESKELRGVLVNSRDVVLVSSMWDSCILATSQIDAYVYMIGIFNTVKKAEQKEEAINYLVNWLNINQIVSA